MPSFLCLICYWTCAIMTALLVHSRNRADRCTVFFPFSVCVLGGVVHCRVWDGAHAIIHQAAGRPRINGPWSRCSTYNCGALAAAAAGCPSMDGAGVGLRCRCALRRRRRRTHARDINDTIAGVQRSSVTDTARNCARQLRLFAFCARYHLSSARACKRALYAAAPLTISNELTRTRRSSSHARQRRPAYIRSLIYSQPLKSRP